MAKADEELLRQLLEGDEEAFVALYRRRQAAIYRFALQMCGSEATAEDVTQEVFMALLRTGSSFDPQRGTLMSFLYGIARNQVYRRYERDRYLIPLEEDEQGNVEQRVDFGGEQESPFVDLTRREEIEQVRQAVLALPAHYREAVVLCDLHEMSYLDAAQVIGCAVGTVRSRLHRARAMLLERLRARREGRSFPATTSGAARGCV